MDWFVNSQDLLMVIAIPLMLVTIRDMRQEWHSLFDRNITSSDRRLLLRIALFLLMPIVVFIHECGHAAAILYYGGKIATFHFGILWGYVVPDRELPALPTLVVYLAGNLVEIVVGLILLIAAVFVQSPPIVALLVYLGLWSVAGTAVVYTLMSLTGIYGDWIAIYTSPVESWVNVIRICHIILVSLILYACYGKAPQLWFAQKTRPLWAAEYKLLSERVMRERSPKGYLDLGWLLYEIGLDRQAKSCVQQALKVDDTYPDPHLLSGWILIDGEKYDKAQSEFQAVAKDRRSSPLLRARGLMGVAYCKLKMINKRTSKEESRALVQEAVDCYSQASLEDPDLADPRFHRASLLNRLGEYGQAEAELLSLEGLNWLDKSLSTQIPKELDIARAAGS